MINPNKRIWQASEIWKRFDFSIPFSSFLKNHFKQNKKYGKRDRAEISHVLYSYLRIGFNSQSLSFEKAAELGLLLSAFTPEELLIEYNIDENWSEFDQDKRIAFCEQKFKIDFYDNFLKQGFELSKEVNAKDVIHKILKQPPVFIRVLRNREAIISALKQAEIQFEEIDDQSLKLAADSKLQLLPKESLTDFYVQDLASQKTIDFVEVANGEKWWDACCGAGGKSLLLKSVSPNIDLMASDVRKSILVNYNSRLKKHGFNPNTKVANLSNSHLNKETFDGILIDAPCSGSGTWGRSPDGNLRTSQLDIEKYAKVQKLICKNAVKSLRLGGKLTYITCSIFKAENENITQYMIDELKLKLVKQGIIHSSKHNSDYLFAAQFINE